MKWFSEQKKECKKSIMPLCLLLLLAAIAMVVLLIAIIAGGRQCDETNMAILIVLAVFIPALVLFVWDVLIPMLIIENRLCSFVDNQGPDGGKPSRRLRRAVFYDVFAEMLDMINESKVKMEKEYTLAMLKKQTELRALQNQINPHFLYNTLDCIRGMAIEQGASNVEEMTKALSGMFRYSISRKGKTSVLLEDEIANVNNYLLIQQYRFRNKIDVQENIEPATKKCFVPKLLVQPIVENAVFHGLEPKMGSRNLNIEAYCTDKRLIVKVEDNGVGMPLEKLNMLNDALCGKRPIKESDRGTQVGLVNVNERLQLLYGKEFGLHVFSCPNVGTTVEMVMPIAFEGV